MRDKSIAVSACLLGHKVRYDGADQELPVIEQALSEQFTLIAICPEMEIGLGVPRNKIELVTDAGQVRVVTTATPSTDLTAEIQQCASDFLKKSAVSGFILKDKSPSCGLGNCRIKNSQGLMKSDGTGIFAAAIKQLKPNMPMLQSDQVSEQQMLNEFIQKVKVYDD